MTAARTPGLDWVRALYAQHSGGYEKHGQDMIVEEGTGRTIAVVYDGAFYSERIVEACNSHDALVTQVATLREALTIALDSLYAMSDRWPFGTETVTHGRCITAIQQARAALAKDSAE